MFRKSSNKTVIALISIFFVIGLANGGCALTKDSVNLEYISQKNVAKVSGADKVTVTVSLEDIRTIKDKVSSKKNGYGMEMAAIVSNNDVAELVKGAITEELQNRGFKVNNDGVIIGIELTKFYNDFKIGMWSGSAAGEVAFNVQVKKADGNIVYAKSITGLDTQKGIQLCSGKNAKAALDGALNDAIAKLMDDESFIEAILKVGS